MTLADLADLVDPVAVVKAYPDVGDVKIDSSPFLATLSCLLLSVVLFV